jgi:hypothetical protein
MLRPGVLFLVALLALGTTDALFAAAASEPLEDAAVKGTARALILRGDLRGFDALTTAFRHSRERTPSGSWKLGLAYLSVTQDLFTPADPRWEKLQQAAAEWLAENPDSPSAVVLDARLLRAHAWAWHDAGARSSDDNPQYRSLLEDARRVLDDHPGVKTQDPEWDALRIAIAREQGADTSQILRMAWAALEREGYYYPLHEAVTNKLMPRWGGSKEAVEQYVQMALGHSLPREGTQAYARIYYYIARSNLDGDPGVDMTETGLLWPPMQQSLTELTQAYPTEFNRDVARSISCIAGRIHDTHNRGRADTVNFVPVAWWDSRQWRETCNGWAFEGKRMHGPLTQRVRAYLVYLRAFGDAFWERIRLAALVTFLLIEGGLALLARLWSARTAAWSGFATASHAFNPMEYPRTYAVAVAREPNFIRLAVWMLFLGGASTYLMALAESPDPLETQIIMAGSVMVAVAGALMIASRFMARVILDADAIAVRALVGGATMKRQDILGVREYQRGKGPRPIEVVSKYPSAASLRLPPVWSEDAAFRAWFDSLQQLALPEGHAPVSAKAR